MKLFQELGMVFASYKSPFAGDMGQLEAMDYIRELCREHLPSGSGFNGGTAFDFQRSTFKKIVLKAAFHHMDEAGGYDGWTRHRITITPGSDCYDFHISVSGRDRGGINEYIADTFYDALDTEV